MAPSVFQLVRDSTASDGIVDWAKAQETFELFICHLGPDMSPTYVCLKYRDIVGVDFFEIVDSAPIQEIDHLGPRHFFAPHQPYTILFVRYDCYLKWQEAMVERSQSV